MHPISRDWHRWYVCHCSVLVQSWKRTRRSQIFARENRENYETRGSGHYRHLFDRRFRLWNWCSYGKFNKWLINVHLDPATVAFLRMSIIVYFFCVVKTGTPEFLFNWSRKKLNFITFWAKMFSQTLDFRPCLLSFSCFFCNLCSNFVHFTFSSSSPILPFLLKIQFLLGFCFKKLTVAKKSTVASFFESKKSNRRLRGLSVQPWKSKCTRTLTWAQAYFIWPFLGKRTLILFLLVTRMIHFDFWITQVFFPPKNNQTRAQTRELSRFKMTSMLWLNFRALFSQNVPGRI